ncbi:MAG: Hg(II)-responsive transcriptional regulator [Sulfuricaulis sp.]
MTLTIGKLAAAAEVNVETVRYYQRRGLLGVPSTPPQGYRRYPAATLKQLRFIKRAQALGFTLSEIAGLLRLDEAYVCAETRNMAAGKLGLITHKIAGLAAMQRVLAGLVRQCDSGDGGSACPIIDALAHGY